MRGQTRILSSLVWEKVEGMLQMKPTVVFKAETAELVRESEDDWIVYRLGLSLNSHRNDVEAVFQALADDGDTHNQKVRVDVSAVTQPISRMISAVVSLLSWENAGMRPVVIIGGNSIWRDLVMLLGIDDRIFFDRLPDAATA